MRVFAGYFYVQKCVKLFPNLFLSIRLIQLASLNKLSDTKSNTPRVTLMHFVAEKAVEAKADIYDSVSQTVARLDQVNIALIDSYFAKTKNKTNKIKILVKCT